MNVVSRHASWARPLLIVTTLAITSWGSLLAWADDGQFNYLVGRSRTDVTGPAVGVQMFGFVRADQISEGIHLRQSCRTFIIADPASQQRLALSVVDIGSVTYELWHEVLDQLQRKYGTQYRRDNFVLTATHTHAGSSGYWHTAANTAVGAPFHGEHFDAIAQAIVESVVAAHEDLRPAQVLIARGRIENASAQRSKTAYENNSKEERARYASDVDQEMTLLKFVDADGAIGTINYFAVHPTSMTYNNRLISGDSKGYAAWKFEKHHAAQRTDGEQFVAAFAQSNCGDVTGNLNLDNTGPGDDDFESTQIIGQRQLDEAVRLFASATERLTGPIEYRQQFVDFSCLEVDAEFTGAGSRMTSPAAFGYSFAAGSTEDGGGHPLFHEGMTRSSRLLDGIARTVLKAPPTSAEMRTAHRPKAILFAPGTMDPPGYGQVLSLGMARIGQLVFVFGPAEFTTMAGRRIRETVAKVLDVPVGNVVIAGFANGYAGYVTTFNEYQTQQYEGGHTLFGPWSEAGYRQQYTRMAKAMAEGSQVDSGPTPRDIRSEATSAPLGTSPDLPPEHASFGDVLQDANEIYHPGDTVEVAYWTGHPQNDYHTGGSFLTIEHQLDGSWIAVDDDGGWMTKCRWMQSSADAVAGDDGSSNPERTSTIPGKDSVAGRGNLSAHQVWIEWTIPSDTVAGTYRIVHHGAYKPAGSSEVSPIEASSRAFQVK